MKSLRTLLILLVCFGLAPLMWAQVALAPSFVFIDENSGVGNVFVSNNSQEAYEISIDFAFGYPDSDAEGNLVMNYEDSGAYAIHALDEMIRAFPRSFVLQGGEQRTVRIQVLPNQRRKEGAFFTRMKVLAQPQAREVTETVVEEGIGTRITFNFEQVTAVFYHKGRVSAGVEIKGVDVRQNEGVLELRPHLLRSGNAPFLGSMYARLKDKNGRVLAETQSTTTVYFDEIRRIDLDLEGVETGSYELELSFETKRNDMMASDLVQAARVVHVQEVRVN